MCLTGTRVLEFIALVLEGKIDVRSMTCEEVTPHFEEEDLRMLPLWLLLLYINGERLFWPVDMKDICKHLKEFFLGSNNENPGLNW